MIALVLVTMVPFVWFGMIVAISFIETPLKFRAPGMTHALGVGIGRLVFQALNRAEAVLAIIIVVAWLFAGEVVSAAAGALLILSMAALALQMLALRPAMAQRTLALAQTALTHDGGSPVKAKVGTSLHMAYIASEALKAVALPVAGILIVMDVAA
ncbi:hypothetical protein [Arthrobacter sp. GMC3]|uniref:hypothetical protein n=1 Tax=Arthrobacter sp. GMC3 TaxID=2058894 RepID=UPI000CE37180|nr:hypothetical protein [Arthrobacter sp. GMC3]